MEVVLRCLLALPADKVLPIERFKLSIPKTG